MTFSKTTRVVNVYGAGSENVGDAWSAPWRYFDLGDVEVVDISRLEELIARIQGRRQERWLVIIGGGGHLLRTNKLDNLLTQLIAGPNDSVVWGAGMNTHTRAFKPHEYWRMFVRNFDGVLPFIRSDASDVWYHKHWLPSYLRGCNLAGVRDFLPGSDCRWVPCASCMYVGFNNAYPVKRRVGIYEHNGVPIELGLDLGEDCRLSNHSVSMEDVIEFLGSSEVIVTSSYHGAYWSTLLRRRVIIYKPFSTKFQFMRYPHIIYSGDLSADIAACETYPDALGRCRTANERFASQVRRFVRGD